MRPLRQRNGSRVDCQPSSGNRRGFFMSKRKSGGAADLPSPPEKACVIVVNAIIDELEVDTCLKDQANPRWLIPSRPSCSASSRVFCALSANRLMSEPDCSARTHLGDNHQRLSRHGRNQKSERVVAASTNYNQAAQLGLALQASHFSTGSWIACCPGTNHTVALQPKRNLFYCGYCRVEGGVEELDAFVARRRSIAAGFIRGQTLHRPSEGTAPCCGRGFGSNLPARADRRTG